VSELPPYLRRLTSPWTLLSLVLALASGAQADQLIQIPTADRVRGATLEYLYRADGEKEGYGSLLFPAGLGFEVHVRHYNGLDRAYRFEGGGQLQILPDGILTPGLSVGMWDVTNSSPWGRRAFVVITKALDQERWPLPPLLNRAQVTLGVGTGRFWGPLAGVRADFPGRVTLVAEYDSRRLNAGFWWAPLKPVTLKAELQNGNPFVGAEFRAPL